jgi:hypothetical protein
LGGEDRHCSADGESRSRMLLEARANGGKWSWDGFTARPLLFRGVANGLAMANAFSLRLVLTPTKLPKDETSDRRKRFLAAEMTKVQGAILNMHTTDSRMGERNSYTGNRPCTERRLVRHHDRGDRRNLRVMVRCHKPLTRGTIPCATHATTRRAGKGN